jgi:hypothetical protein
VSRRWWIDRDGDGFGSWYSFLDSPAQPPGYVGNHGDCMDTDPSVNHGVSTDPKDGLDNDCDGVVDEDRGTVRNYPDADGDGWGATKTEPVWSTTAIAGDATRTGDCNDNDPTVHPGTSGCGKTDLDGDGHRKVASGGDDCDDGNPLVYPGHPEVMFDGYDNDCDSHTADDSHRDANFPAPTQRDLLPVDGRSNA